MRFKTIILVLIFLSIGFSSSRVNITQSNINKLDLTISFKPTSVNDFKPFYILVGLPSNRLPNLNIEKTNIRKFSAEKNIESTVKWFQVQKLRGLWVGTLEITPGIVDNQYYSAISVHMDFDESNLSSSKNDDLLESKIVNWEIARNWINNKTRSLAKIQELPSGQWVKFRVTDDNVYKINGNALNSIFPSSSDFDTRSFMMYTSSNLGRAQSQVPGFPSPSENLTEIAFQYNGSTDGTFSASDEILFYGRGSNGFDNNGITVSYNKNLYFEENIYWLLIPDNSDLRGKRISTYQNTQSPALTINYGIRYQHIETDLVNPFESGLGWAEQSIANNSYFEKSIDIKNPVDDISAKLTVGFLGSTSDFSTRPFPLNSISSSINQLQSDNLGSISWSGLGQRKPKFTIPYNLISNGTNSFYFQNISSDGYSQPYFDYLNISYGQQLVYDGEEFEFYTPIHSNTVNYSIDSNESITIWKITDSIEPLQLNLDQSGNKYNFTISTPPNTFDRVAVFDKNDIPVISNIEYIGQKSFSTLANSTTQSNHVIISTNAFANVANKLIDHRQNSIFAPLETIYDEFSGGNHDPMAIRNFIKWTQNNWQSPQPIEIFILGDADYDYRNITGNSNIIVPTVEVGITGSYATDDRLAAINGSIPDVALGRFPAQDPSEAEIYIDKLVEFETNPEYGLWRQRVTLVADDGARPEDSISELQIGKSHTINSETLASIIPKEIETYKLYMLEFPEESNTSSFGVAKPEATSALFDILKKGTAIINYIGHGSAHQWAQERLLFQNRGDLQAINTGMKLPIWIAGTCSWGHFDNIGNESFSEELIRQPMNGASAIITTSRAITVTSNQYYEEQLFNQLFPNKLISDKSIGVILQSIKIGNQEGEYFHLFGDPAMKLPLPTEKINITSVSPDTLLTLGESNYTAEQTLSDVGGVGYTILKEENREVTREYNYLSNIESLTYELPGATLFRGQFSFDGHNISGQFRIPKDISLSSNSTSLKLYAHTQDNNPIEGLGLIDSLIVLHGSDTNDNFGPIINFETASGRILRSGDHIQNNDDILIRITDPLGINLTGETGHDIILTDLIQESENIITDDFIYDNNSITSGTIQFNIDEMSSDIHIGVEAWDSANNLAENNVKLIRITESKLKLYNILNFPNPFSKTTQFTFELSQPADVSIAIFTLGGKKIMDIDPEYFSSGFHTIYWNGKDAYGDKLANGVYLYKIKAKGDGEAASFIGRLAKYE